MLIDGTGTLVEVKDLKATTGSPGKGINRYAGTMVNGLWNGLAVHSDEYPKGSATYPPHKFTMGCTDQLGPCTPPRPLASTVPSSDDQNTDKNSDQRASDQASGGLQKMQSSPSPKPSAPNPASEFAFNFLKEVGCSQLPFAACEVLDRDNAINILRTYETLLVNKQCGTGNIQAAKQLVEVDMALDNDRCRAVLKGVGAI